MNRILLICIVLISTRPVSAQKLTFSDGLSVVCEYDRADTVKSRTSKHNYTGDWIDGKGGRMVCYVNRRCSVVDTFGNIVIPADYVDIRRIGDIFKAYKDKRYYLIDRKGEVLTPNGCNYVFEKSGFFIVGNNKKEGIYNMLGKKIIPLDYEHVTPFSDGLFRATKDRKMGLIDIQNHVIVDFKYAYIAPPSNGKVKTCECDEPAWPKNFNKDYYRYYKKGYREIESGVMIMCKNPLYDELIIE